MQLSEAIKQLQAILKDHGDIDIEIAYPSNEIDVCTYTSNSFEIYAVHYGKNEKRCRVEDIG